MKGFGIIANILAIINELPLAHWKTMAGLRLRQAMFVNVILYNSEAWQGIKDKDLFVFEKADEALLRGILGAHPKIPIEALYLETKSTPIRYIIASRRIMYLHAILKKDETEMLRRVYEAQTNDPSPGDFTELVKQDRDLINLNLSDSEISRIPKQRFRNLVKSKISNATFRYLHQMKEGHSKMKGLKYEKFELMQYLNSPLFSNTNRNLLLALRTRTVRGIRKDFRGLYQDIQCPIGCETEDTCTPLHRDKTKSRKYRSHSDVS